jgi:hypothetical protein
VRHRQTKEAATDRFEPTATAPHLDSTDSRPSLITYRRLTSTSLKGGFLPFEENAVYDGLAIIWSLGLKCALRRV